MPHRVLVAAVLMLVLAPPAQASFQGTPGKVAYITGVSPAPLKIWDPATAATDPQNANAGVTTLVPETFKLSTADRYSLGYPSAPSWSPDGTRLAYTKSIDGTGNSPLPIDHTAVFVYDLKTGQHTQVSQPAATLVDTDSSAPYIGHSVADTAAAWSGDGTKIAFVRQTSAQQDDALKADDGYNLWTVNAAGGGETRHTSFAQASGKLLNSSLVWVPGRTELLAGLIDNGNPKLVRIGLGGGYTEIAQGQVTDFDASPDGNRFSYSTIDGGTLQTFEGDIDTGAAVQEDGISDLVARYSNSGDALLYRGGDSAQPGVVGLRQRVIDPDQHDPGPASDRVVLPWRATGVAGGAGLPGRMELDIQPQTLPVIFVPGFLGSTVACSGDELWPDMPFPALTGMNLTASGQANANCATAAPTELLETVLGSDVYKSTADWLRGAFDSARLTLFGWDWRKQPQESYSALDQAITDALGRDGPWKDQQAGRVTLYGHSYGGLLIRSFIETDAGARVGRVLTAGTPYWGAPKSVFPLAFGIESPLFSTFDLLIPNANMQSLAVNLAGLYHLYPSDHFGSWLSVNGGVQDQAGVANFVTVLGGNSALFNQALANHRDHLDGYTNRDGFIDVRVIAGSGKMTIRSFNLTVQPNDDLVVDGLFGNGDETVPLKSASQVDGGPPLGDPVGLQYTCNTSHVPLPGSGPVKATYEKFLDVGRPPQRLLITPCAAGGGSYRFESSTIGRAPATRTLAGPMNFDDALTAGLANVMDAGPRTLVVVNDDTPVSLTTQITNGTFTYTPLANETRGTTLEYGPVTGALKLEPGAAGGAPAVTLGGQLIAGKPLVAPDPPVDPGPGPGGTTTGDATTTAQVTGAPGPAAITPGLAQPGPASAPATRFAFVGLPKLKGRRLTLTISVPAAGKLGVGATQRRGSRTVKLGSAKATLAATGKRAMTVKLSRRPARGTLKIAVAFTPAKGALKRLSATLKVR